MVNSHHHHCSHTSFDIHILKSQTLQSLDNNPAIGGIVKDYFDNDNNNKNNKNDCIENNNNSNSNNNLNLHQNEDLSMLSNKLNRYLIIIFFVLVFFLFYLFPLVWLTKHSSKPLSTPKKQQLLPSRSHPTTIIIITIPLPPQQSTKAIERSAIIIIRHSSCLG